MDMEVRAFGCIYLIYADRAKLKPMMEREV